MIPCKVQPYAQSARKMPRGMKGRHAVDMVWRNAVWERRRVNVLFPKNYCSQQPCPDGGNRPVESRLTFVKKSQYGLIYCDLIR